MHDQPFVTWSYDIECQHDKNRVARFTKWFPDLADVAACIVGCIPSMHIHNHKEDCQYRYAFKYTPNVGCTCGEGIEQTWAEAGQTGGSTKKENCGHRHNSLDDFHGYWNWEKILKMGESTNLCCRVDIKCVICSAFAPPPIYQCKIYTPITGGKV